MQFVCETLWDSIMAEDPKSPFEETRLFVGSITLISF